MKEWFENDTFWESLYPYLFNEEKFLSTPEEVNHILNLTNVVKGKVLDACCGPGRHSVELAKRGFRVTSVDISPFLLNKAKSRAKKENVSVEWIQDDIRKFVKPDTFDLALNMFTSFGFFDDKSDDLRVLKNIFKSLKNRGILVMDSMCKERMARIFQPTTSTELDDGSFLVQRHEIFDDWSRVRNEWILISKGKATSFKFNLTIYSGQELKQLLQNAGFSKVTLYGNLEGEPFRLDSTRLVIVAVK